MSLFCSMKEDVRDLYTSAADTYLPSARPAITSVAAAVAGCCRICSITVNRLISAAVIVSYLRQNSRLLDDNSGPVVGSQFCSVAKICRSNRIRKSGLPLTITHRARQELVPLISINSVRRGTPPQSATSNPVISAPPTPPPISMHPLPLPWTPEGPLHSMAETPGCSSKRMNRYATIIRFRAP